MPLKPIKTKDRFENIKSNPRKIVLYAEGLKKRVPHLEHIILQDDLASYWYAYYVLHKRWPEAEKQMLSAKPLILNTYVINRYAQNVIKDRWPEAEPILKTDKFEWEDYVKHFNIWLEI